MYYVFKFFKVVEVFMEKYKILAELLEESVKKRVEGKDVGVAFSGGIDSSTMAFLSKKYANSVTLYTVGIEGSQDVEYAKEISKYLDLKWVHIKVDEKSVEEGLRDLAGLFGWIGERTPIIFSFQMPLFFVLKNSSEKNIVTGQGSDELFLGYHKFQEKEIPNFDEIMNGLWKEIRREKMIADYFDKELFFPFLDKKILDLAKEIPIEEKLGNMEKQILRNAAKFLGLPDIVIKRRKKSAQYGSGIMKLIRKVAKKHGTDVTGLVKRIIEETKATKQ